MEGRRPPGRPRTGVLDRIKNVSSYKSIIYKAGPAYGQNTHTAHTHTHTHTKRSNNGESSNDHIHGKSEAQRPSFESPVAQTPVADICHYNLMRHSERFYLYNNATICRTKRTQSFFTFKYFN